ncbi:hypothetical protein HU755_24520 [Pseudomonas sp. SWRI111]|uniref:hypothetical protein n=1 Tax=Pseudomonas sp. SWRI111 TaxID=2745507 RepID=UPI0016443482|nr:hypothetical protein [Pseudomonas sp. SWRI111]MBC3209978.1 hypothetical protein [Pseudomonas sp. SWRI111]
MPAINDSWACSGEFIKKVYRLPGANLDRTKNIRKMPQAGIDVTLTSCFTGFRYFICYIQCGATSIRTLGSRA